MTRTALEGYALNEAEKARHAASLRDVHHLGGAAGKVARGCDRAGPVGRTWSILGKDPLTASGADFMNIPVDITLVGGRIVYERGRPTIAHSDSAELHSGQ